MAVTASPLLGGDMAVCRTLDVSDVGMSLDTAAWFPLGTRLGVSLIDPSSGTAFEVVGDVVREAQAPDWTLGVLVIDPPVEWHALVSTAKRASGQLDKPGKRMRVLVVGDDQRQRGAMALYVTSGWDVLFASDDASLHDAIHHIELDAVIAELDAADPRVAPIMEDVKTIQPSARRIVRGGGSGPVGLVHRYLSRDAGLDALVDAVTAEIPAAR